MFLSAAFFYLFAIVCVGSAFMVISARNPVHAVLFLILAFFNASGLFIMLGAEFLAMILVVVYVGAAAFSKYLPIGATVGLLLLVELIFVIAAWVVSPGSSPQAPMVRGMSNTAALGEILYTKYVYLFESAGLILLVAMIGAIVLTLQHKEGVRRQSIAAQVRRKSSVELVKVQSGRGLP